MATVAQTEDPAIVVPSVDAVEAAVRRLLGGTYPVFGMPERRADQRFPFARLAILRAIDESGTPLATKPAVAVGKHISMRGIGFFHPEPIPHRLVAAEFELLDHEACLLVVELKWCRFTRQGWYESGGRFVTTPAVRSLGEVQAGSQDA